jgi:hypothetical protein
MATDWRKVLERLVKATLGNDPVELEEALQAAQDYLEGCPA